MGEIVLELDHDKAPKSVDNFLQYVKSGFYKGTIFHRVIDGFMIQGGGMDAKLTAARPTPVSRTNRNNGLSNAAYTVAMAREPAPDSATSQFFINVVDNRAWTTRACDGFGYTVFGKVMKGQEVVDKIKAVLVDDVQRHGERARHPIEIKSATIVKAKSKIANS
jgi:peptidyl-prolyl cis-trans isomerase A (cyclophilin A)